MRPEKWDRIITRTLEGKDCDIMNEGHTRVICAIPKYSNDIEVNMRNSHLLAEAPEMRNLLHSLEFLSYEVGDDRMMRCSKGLIERIRTVLRKTE